MRSVSFASKRTSKACTASFLRYKVMRTSAPPNATLESSQRRSAARLFHSSSLQWMLGNLFFTSLSRAPSPTPLTSYAAAGRAASSIASRLIFRIDFTAPEAAALVVVHHAHGLHECIHDSRADELEAAPLKVLRKLVGSAASQFPDVLREAAAFLLHREKAARVGNRGIDLRPVAHDAWIREQPLAIFGAIKSNSVSIKPVKCAPVIRALGEDGVPRKPGLRAFQDEELEQLAVVPDRHAPLLDEVGDVERIARRGAAASRETGALRAKPSNRSSSRSRHAQSGSSGPSTSCGLITRAHWNTENRM